MILPAPEGSRLAEILRRIERDGLLPRLWALSIVNSARASVNDHGPTHVKIVAHGALKILRLLLEAGIVPSVVKDHGMANEDAEIVVALAGLLHDVGMSVHRDGHESHSLFIVSSALPRLLEGLYDPASRQIVVSETLHAMIGHNHAQQCLTVEAGVVKVADALDMSKWRSRYIIRQGRVSIHSLSAAAIDKVSVSAGKTRPVAVEVTMNNSAGIFQVDTLLKDKLAGSGLSEYFEVTTRVTGDAERQHIQQYKL